MGKKWTDLQWAVERASHGPVDGYWESQNQKQRMKKYFWINNKCNFSKLDENYKSTDPRHSMNSNKINMKKTTQGYTVTKLCPLICSKSVEKKDILHIQEKDKNDSELVRNRHAKR